MNLLRIAARVAERNKGLFRNLKKEYPNIPDYVVRDVYNATNRGGEKAKSGRGLEGMLKYMDTLEWKLGSVPLHWDVLAGTSKSDATRRKFGIDNPDSVDEDAERLERQMKSIGQDNEPLVVYDISGKIQIVEGWHRAMARMMSGSKDLKGDLKKIGESKSDRDVEVVAKSWKPVQTKAWIGKEVMKDVEPEAEASDDPDFF